MMYAIMGYVKEELSNQAGTISHLPSRTVDLIQPAKSTEMLLSLHAHLKMPPSLSVHLRTLLSLTV